jgi:hypothetical protein
MADYWIFLLNILEAFQDAEIYLVFSIFGQPTGCSARYLKVDILDLLTSSLMIDTAMTQTRHRLSHFFGSFECHQATLTLAMVLL